MHPKDSFFKRLQPLDNYAHLFSKQQRFGTWNPETLGIMLVRFCKVERYHKDYRLKENCGVWLQLDQETLFKTFNFCRSVIQPVLTFLVCGSCIGIFFPISLLLFFSIILVFEFRNRINEDQISGEGWQRSSASTSV